MHRGIDFTLYNCTDCSWNTYTPNSVFSLSAQFNNISLFSDEQIPVDNPQILCMPEKFGYSIEDAERLFPHKGFPRCVDKLKDKRPIMRLDLETNTLIMNCTNKHFKGKFSLGCKAGHEEIGLLDYTQEFIEYKGKPYKLTTEEFAYGTCIEDKEKELEQAVYSHRPLPHLLERNKQQTQTPLAILLLTLDSVSRRGFFRKLPKTVEFLNALNAEEYKVFDFKIHNVMGEYSANNVMPMLFGSVPFKMHREILRGDPFYPTSIWKAAKENNFTTLIIDESCNEDLSRYFGRNPSVDHIGSYFWCAAMKYNNFRNNLADQRCIGRENSHTYIFNYIQEFSQNYNNLNQWVYTHINTAHENSGLVIETLDEDLTNFLKKYLMSNKDKEVAIFLNGDHGMRYGEWFKKIDGSHEHRLPVFLFIGSNQLLNRIPNSLDVLTHNSNRLTSRLDLYTTQLHLIYSKKHEIHRDSEIYDGMKKNASDSYASISVLLEKAKNDRTCEEVGIPAFWCSCLPFTQVNYTDYEHMEDLVLDLAEDVVYNINEDVYSSKSGGYHHICQKISLKSVLKLWYLGTKEEYYKLQISINESPDVIFEAVVLLTHKNYRSRSVKDAFTVNPYYATGKKRSKIMYIRRVDSYAGPCEVIARSKRISAELCVCYDLKYIYAQEPLLEDYVKHAIF